jgi:hypothetical protein
MTMSEEEISIIIVGLAVYEVKKTYLALDKKLKRIQNSATVSHSST